jgi:hypothetical protein
MDDLFGSTDPKRMPPHFFFGALHIDYTSAVPAEVAAQDYSVAPRHWYIDARFRCCECRAEFVWPTAEQKTWFEVYRFYVDSLPTRCRECRAKRRDAVRLRQEYDELVSAARSRGSSPEQKQRVVTIIDELESYWSVLPEKMLQTRNVLRQQLTEQKSN